MRSVYTFVLILLETGKGAWALRHLNLPINYDSDVTIVERKYDKIRMLVTGKFELDKSPIDSPGQGTVVISATP